MSRIDALKHGHALVFDLKNLLQLRGTGKRTNRALPPTYLSVDASFASYNVTIRRSKVTSNGVNDNSKRVEYREQLNLSKSFKVGQGKNDDKKSSYKNNLSHKPHNNRNRDNPNISLNKELAAATEWKGILTLIQNDLTNHGGGERFNSVCFATSIHRLGKFNFRYSKALVRDDRFALLLASLAEALVLNSPISKQQNKYSKSANDEFQLREFSNIVWGIAKLDIVPSASVMALIDCNSSKTDTCLSNVEKALLVTATNLRELVRQSTNDPSITDDRQIMLAHLAGQIMDFIGISILVRGTKDNRKCAVNVFSTLLWSWTTAKRVNPETFAYIMRKMIQAQQIDIEKSVAVKVEPVLCSYNWSIAIWALASAQVRIENEELIQYVSNLLDSNQGWISSFTSQHLSNTCFGVSALLLGGSNQISKTTELSALRIFRHIASEVIQRNGSTLTPHGIASIARSLVGVRFGVKPTLAHEKCGELILHSDRQENDTKIMKQLIDVLVDASILLLEKFEGTDITDLVWAMTHVEESKTAYLQSFIRSLVMKLTDPSLVVTPNNFCITLMGITHFPIFDDKMYRAVASRLITVDLSLYEPRDLATILVSFAKAEVDVNVKYIDISRPRVPEAGPIHPTYSDSVTQFFSMVADELMSRPDQFKPRSITEVLWSFSSVGIHHPVLFETIALCLLDIRVDKQQSRFPKEMKSSTTAIQKAPKLKEFDSLNLKSIRKSYLEQLLFAEKIGNTSIDQSNQCRTVDKKIVDKLVRAIGRELNQRLTADCDHIE